MDKKLAIPIRGLLIIIGVLLIIFEGSVIYSQISPQFFSFIKTGDITTFNLNYSDFIFQIILIIIGYFMIILGINWNNIFKSLANTAISFAVIFLTLAITIYPIYSNAQELSNSVQPTIDYVLAGSIDKILLEQLPISNGNSLNLIIDGKTTAVVIGDLNTNDLNIIWKDLGFDESVSYETKNITTNVLLSLTYGELENKNIQSIPIPMNLLGQFIQASNETKQIKNIVNYDFFNKNISLRAENLNKLRLDCENKIITLDQLCGPIMMTKYEVLIKNVTSDSNSQVPKEILPILKDIDTKDKLKLYIENSSSSWIIFTVLSIFLFLLGSLLIYIHLKFNQIKFTLTEIIYYVSKRNLGYYVPSYIILVIIYFIMTGEKIIELISQSIPKEFLFGLNLVITSPLFAVFIKLFEDMMLISTIYLLFSFILFSVFYFILKKQEKHLNNNFEN